MLLKTISLENNNVLLAPHFTFLIVDDEYIVLWSRSSLEKDKTDIFVDENVFEKIRLKYLKNIENQDNYLDLIYSKYAYIERTDCGYSSGYMIIINNIPIAYLYGSQYNKNDYFHRMYGKTVIKDNKFVLYLKEIING